MGHKVRELDNCKVQLTNEEETSKNQEVSKQRGRNWDFNRRKQEEIKKVRQKERSGRKKRNKKTRDHGKEASRKC